MNIKLIGLDLDGTLFNDEKRISENNYKAVKEAMDKGILAVPVSGRPITGLPSVFKDEYKTEYAVTTNGASVYNLRTGECIYHSWMETEKAVRLLKIAEKYGTVTCCFVHGQGYMDNSKKLLIPNIGVPSATKEYFYTDMIFVDNIFDYLMENADYVEKLAINFDFKNGKRVGGHEAYKEFCEVEEITVVSGERYNYEITQKDVTKASGLKHLAKILGIKMEEIMAIGDDCNDYEMIKSVGLGIAMENANPLLKEVADDITTDNNNDGVAAAINKYILKGE